MKNYCMMEHGFVEATAFEGIMPEIAEKVGTVGASDVIVKMHGFEAKGQDALEVMDIQASAEESVETNEKPESEEIVEGE